MSDTPPDRITTSTTPFRASTPRHIPSPPPPPKRWYLRGDRRIREIFAALVVDLSVLWCGVFALLFIIGAVRETLPHVGRAFAVITAIDARVACRVRPPRVFPAEGRRDPRRR